MSDRNGSEWDVEIVLADGTTTLGLMLDLPEGYGEGDDLDLPSVLTAQSADTPVSERLRQRVMADLSGGMGVDYNLAQKLITRIPGYVLSAGAVTSVTMPVPHNSATPIVAIAEYGADLFVAQQGSGSANTARVMRSVGGSGAGGGLFADSLNLGANEYLRDLLVADDGSGTSVLWASSSDVGGLNGRLHKWNGTAWTSTAAGAFGTHGRNRMASEYMVTSDGNGAPRIVFITGPKTIAYTLPDSDPLDPASYVEGVLIDTPGTLLEIAAARRHFWLTDTLGRLYDVDELGHSSNLIGYGTQTAQPFAGTAVVYQDGYVYLSSGRGYVRVRVGDTPVLNEFPGQCGPGFNTPARNKVRGVVTAACLDQSWHAVSVYNQTTNESFICYGIDRSVVGETRTRNPMVWHGPEIVPGPFALVTRMATSALVSGEMRLWIAIQIGGAMGLAYASIPISGSALDDLESGGTMKFTTDTGRLELLPDDWDDKARNKILYQISIGSEGPLDASTKIDLYARADPAPGSTSWTSLGSITASPNQDVTLPAVVQGHKTQLRLDFINPSGGASTPIIGVLDSIRQLAWEVAPAVRMLNPLAVRYGDTGHPGDGAVDRDPGWITEQLVALTGATATTVRLWDGARWTAKVQQVLESRERLHASGTWGRSVHTQLQVSLLAKLS